MAWQIIRQPAREVWGKYWPSEWTTKAGTARALDPDGLHSVTDVGFPEKDVTPVTAALWGEADPEGDAGCRSSFLLP